MDSESFETVLLSFLFVLNLAGIGFLISIIVKAIGFYIDSPSATNYSYLVRTKLFAAQNFPNYILTATVFAGLGLVITYVWKQKRSIRKMIFGD